MRKIQIVVIVSLLTFLMVSCASKKKNDKSQAEAPVQSVEVLETGGETLVVEVVDSKKNKKNKKDKNKNNGKSEEEKDKKTAKNVSVDFGIIKLSARTKLGTFNVGVIDENGKVIQALSSANESSGNVFYLKYGKKIYKLQSAMDIKTSAVPTSSGMRIIYTIDNAAEVTVDFTCMKSSATADADILKITATVTNIGKRKVDIGLKCVLDTVLGESKGNHFYSSSNTPITAETVYRTMKNEKWFLSKNSDVAMQILLDGADISATDIVALGNKATLSSMVWEPNVSATRAFDTVLSYNDSCIGVLWPSSLVATGDSKKYTMYLAFDNTGHIPQGAKFINPDQGKLESTEEKIVNNVVIIEPPSEKAKIPIVTISDFPTVEDVYEPAPVSNKIEIKPNQIEPEYIQALIDRISELESDGSNTNTEELNRLTRELDAILEYLR